MIGEKIQIRQKYVLLAAGVFCCLTAIVLAVLLISSRQQEKYAETAMEVINPILTEETENVTEEEESTQEVIFINPIPKPEIQEAFLTPNEYSRPQEPLEVINEIFIHYTANPGTTAEQNRSYFENLGITGETSASAHFIIDIFGHIK